MIPALEDLAPYLQALDELTYHLETHLKRVNHALHTHDPAIDAATARHLLNILPSSSVTISLAQECQHLTDTRAQLWCRVHHSDGKEHQQ